MGAYLCRLELMLALTASAFEMQLLGCSVLTWETTAGKQRYKPAPNAHERMHAYMRAASGQSGNLAIAGCCIALVVLGVALNSLLGHVLMS